MEDKKWKDSDQWLHSKQGNYRAEEIKATGYIQELFFWICFLGAQI